MDARFVARGVAAGRVAIGLAIVLAPRRVTGAWLGVDVSDRFVPVVARGLGARDVALGVGTLAALRHGDDVDVHRWLEAAIVADVSDGVATLLAGRPDRNRALVVALATAGAGVGALVRTRLG